MIEQNEIPDIDGYGDILLAIIESEYPSQTEEDHYRKRVLSGDPKQIYGRCGYAASVAVAKKLSLQLLKPIEKVISDYKDGNGHEYLLSPEKDLIIDATAGQFIPQTSRVGFEKYFRGNMFIGSRTILKQICLNGVVNTRTQNDPQLSFQRIWGDRSMSRMPKSK
ncbi:hypothetical protein HY612_02030 [Candidatus Roizmanbacteria bacterium]|nr:hypothetical protein [Candidatus Roizmanbacteria bacterium]